MSENLQLLASSSGERPDKTRLRRFAQRGEQDREQIYAILDAGLMCHIGYVFDGYPVVTPTLYWREGDLLCWHGSKASRMIRAVHDQEVCVTISTLDGVVLAHSAYHHSANYRSAMLFGRASLVSDPDAKMRHLKTMMETIAPGRFERLRPVLSQELKATSILTLPIDCFSVKTRSGDVSEDEADLDWPVWAGVVPYKQQLAEPVRAAGVGDQFDAPILVRPV